MAQIVLVIDWPSRDVPDTLTRAGYTTIVKGGPEPDNYSTYELRDGEVVARRLGGAPEHVDLIYAHRPFDELLGIVALAERVGAKGIWCQSGLSSDGAKDPKGCFVPEERSRRSRQIVEAAGLSYVDDLYIADAVRGLRAQSG
jgi:hypothetical protein